MARLIDADALPIKFDGHTVSVWKCDLDAAPTVDAVPVVHARWIAHNKGQNNWVECSECNTVGSPFWKCCPVCTAMMDGGNGDAHIN